MEVRTITCGALVNDADGISTSQTPAAGGAQNLTITGNLAADGAVTLSGAAQIVTITSAGDDSGRTFTVTGTDADGTAVTESITGANAGAADGSVYFQTITQVSTDDDTAGAVTVGVLSANGGVSQTLEVYSGEYGQDYQDAVYVDQTGTATWHLETTAQKVNDTYSNGYNNDAQWIAPSAFSGKSADVSANLTVPTHGLRVRVSSYTDGTVTARYIRVVPKD